MQSKKINIERENPDCFQLSIKYGLQRDDFYQLTVIITYGYNNLIDK